MIRSPVIKSIHRDCIHFEAQISMSRNRQFHEKRKLLAFEPRHGQNQNRGEFNNASAFKRSLY